MKNYRPYIISILVIAIGIALFYYLGEIILPFFIGLIGAYLVNPLIKRMHQKGLNRNLVVTTYLFGSLILFLGIGFLFGAELVRDVKRLNNGIQTFVTDHQSQIDESNEQVRTFIQSVYSMDEFEKQIEEQKAATDSSSTAVFDQVKTAFGSLTSFFDSSENTSTKDDQPDRSLNWMLIFFSSIGYFIYILYTYPYFEQKLNKYFDQKVKNTHAVQEFIQDFQRIFMHYFKQRTKIVLINFCVFLTAFLIIDLPASILIALFAALLSYISHFHFIALLPSSLGCWILAMETGNSFWLYFGIVAAVLLLMSILEEVWFYDKIMKDFNGMNPAIMIVSFAIWTHLFGLTIGTLIALPLTTVLLIYVDRLLLYLKEHLTTPSSNQE